MDTYSEELVKSDDYRCFKINCAFLSQREWL